MKRTATAEPATQYRLRPLNSSSNLSEQTAAILRDAIKGGEIQPGTHLIEQDIAEQLGISRIPVRKAIEQLIEERLVIKNRHKGAFVHPYSPEELDEIYSLRVLLEQVVVERVMANWSVDKHEELQAIFDRMVEAEAVGDKQLLDDLDTVFHQTLWKMAKHGVLEEMLTMLRARSHLTYFVRDQRKLAHYSVFIEAHRSLLEALNRGDVMEARQEMKRHIERAKKFIQDYYAYLQV